MPQMFWPVILFMAVSLAIGLYTYTKVRGSSVRFTVCDKSLPFIIVGTALFAQAVDGNSTLGNTSLTWAQGFWVGAMIPLGLSVSLLIVGKFLAEPLHRMNLLTLPEFFLRRYGKVTELLVSVLCLLCFIVLVAGNLAAVGWILTVATGIHYVPALLIGTAVIVLYTIAGGLYSAVWTDFFQEHLALIGFVGGAVWLILHLGWDSMMSAIPKARVDFSALTSLPAGALPNWANLISLSIGNCMALDFMERVFAAKSPKVAKMACYYAAGVSLLIGLCASIFGLASYTLVKEIADPRMVLPQIAAETLPYWLGVLVFVGVLGASMSTANGAMLVMSVVLARNVIQRWRKDEINDSTMLLLSRVLAIPTAIAAGTLAILRPEPGILLVVAFDIVFAGCVVPLFLGVYWPKANSAGAVAAILAGTLSRLIAHFVTPPQWAGLDTLIPPLISVAAFWMVCMATAKGDAGQEQALAVEGYGD